MNSYKPIVVRGLRLIVVVALVFSIAPMDVAAAQPTATLQGAASARSGAAAPAAEDRVEALHPARVYSAARDQSLNSTLLAPDAVGITATKRDALVVDVDGDTKADPGDTLEYTAIVTNSGSTDATAVQFNDTLDANTTLVGGSLSASPVAANDLYSQTVVGNVSISSTLISFSVLSNDYLGLNPPATITAYDATSANGGNVVVHADGTFTYNPPAGFEGTDTFSYTLSNSTGSNVGVVSLPVSGMVWFINNTAPSCTTVAAGCGRLSNPFSTLAAFNSANGAPDIPASHIFNPAANDNIFIYESASAYSGAVTLLTGQKLIGQDATASLAAITGLTAPGSSAPFPAMDSTNGTITNLSSTVTLNTNVTVRGLQINSTTSTGLNDPAAAITGVSVSDISIATTTGTAVLLSSAGGTFTFKSVSANGAVNGISLSSTTGSFTITGDSGSTNNSSGGTLQNTSGNGISLATAQNISLDQMSIQTTSGSGVNGTGVTNFAFTNGTINNAGNATPESAIAFNGSGSLLGNNIAGTLTVTGNTFTNPFYSGLDVQSDNGTVTVANISNNTVSNPGFSGINLVGTGNASTAFNLNRATINQNNISSSGGNGIQVSIGNSSPTGPGATAGSLATSSDIIAITNNSISIDLTGTQAIAVANSGGNSLSRTKTNFLMECNGRNTGGCTAPTGSALGSSSIGTVILIGNNGHADMIGTVNNNAIVATHTPGGGGGNGIGGGNGVAGAGSAWTPNLTLLVTNNSISGTDGNGILLVGRGTSGTANLKVANNNVGAPVNAGGSARQGIRIDAGNASSADDAVCLNIFGNTSAGSNGAAGLGVRKQGTVTTVNDFGIQNITPNPPTNTDVVNYINSQNASGGGTDIINGSNFVQCSVPAINFVSNSKDGLTQNNTEPNPQTQLEVAGAKQAPVETADSVNFVKPVSGNEAADTMNAIPAAVEAPTSGETINVTIGTLPSNESLIIKFRATINNPIPPGVLQVSNQGTVSGSNFTSVLTDDPDTGTANDPTVTPLDVQVDLQVAKAVTPTTAYPGSPITYTITYLNAGPQPSANVVITDPLPTALTGVAYQSSATITPTGSYVWAIGPLLNGQGGVITVTGTINPALGAPTVITNTAIITGTGRDTNTGNNTASVSLSITDQPISGLSAINSSPTLLGSATHFTATVTTGTNVVYQWNFGDGNTANGATASYTYAAVGTYTATVTATNTSSSQVATTSVTVVDVPIAGLSAANSSPTRVSSATNFTATINAGSNVTYAWDFGDGAIGSGATPTHTYAAVGTYTATVTATNSVNQQVATTVVTVIDQPITGLNATNDSPTQLGNTTNFTATIGGGTNVTYQWNFGDGTTGSGANTSRTYGAVGSYVATVTATNGVSVVVATTNVSIVDLPVTGLTAANSSPTILGNSTAFTATISGGTNVIYTWNFGDGVLGSGATTSHTYAAVGTYTATVTATNGINSQVATTIVSIFDTPITGLTATSDSPTRLGNATNFTATTTGGSGITYTWDFGDGNSGSGANPSHTYAALGTYTATVTATNSLNSQTASTVVIVIDQPIVGLTAANDSPTPLGSVTHFTATLSNGTNVTYQWNFGDGVLGSGVTTSHTYGAIGSYVATVTATNGVSVVVATTNVSIIDTPIVNLVAANDSPTQLGNVTHFTATIGGGSNVTYQWNFGDGVLGSGATASHTYGAIGAYVATVTATNGVSVVVATTNVSIIDRAIVGLAATNNSPTGLGNATLFTATISDGSNVVYAWDFGDGNIGGGANTSHVYSALGTYTATVTATNGVSVVVASTVATVINQPISGLSAINNSPTRLGSATAFTATIATGSTVSYAWDFGDGATGSGANAAHTYAAVGTYTATVTATNTLNSQTASTIIVVIDRAIVGLGASNDSPTRLGNTTAFTATISDGSNVAYQWNFGDGSTGSGANANHVYGAVGAYAATVTATNGVSVVVATTNVSIIDTPIVGLAAANSSPTGLGLSTALTATIGGGSNVAYAWNFGDGSLGSGAMTSHIYPALGAYTATVTATNGVSNGVATTIVTIVDQPLSNLNATSSSPTLLGNTSFFTATANGTSVIYTWSFGDGTTGSGANPAHTYAATGLYTAIVTATNSTGSLTATVKVNVFSGKVYLPLIARNYVSAPDLVVTSLKVSTGNAQVVIKNQGDLPVTDGFYVDVYINPNPAPVAVNQIWSDGRSAQGLTWGVTSSMQPGQVLTLTIGDAYYLPDYSIFTGTLPIGTPVYAQVDSLNAVTTYGAVRENHEINGSPYNNILGPVLSAATLSPLSMKHLMHMGNYWLPVRLKVQ